MSGDIFGCHNWGGRRHLVGGGQGCCSIPYSTQDVPPRRIHHAQTSVMRKPGLCPYVRPEVDKWPYSPSNLLCNLPAPVFFLPRVPASAPTLPLGCSVNPRSPQTTSSNILGGHARDRSSQRFYSWPLQWPEWGLPPLWALSSLASTPHGTFSSQFLNHRISLYCPFSPDPTLGSRFPSPNDG